MFELHAVDRVLPLVRSGRRPFMKNVVVAVDRSGVFVGSGHAGIDERLLHQHSIQAIAQLLPGTVFEFGPSTHVVAAFCGPRRDYWRFRVRSESNQARWSIAADGVEHFRAALRTCADDNYREVSGVATEWVRTVGLWLASLAGVSLLIALLWSINAMLGGVATFAAVLIVTAVVIQRLLKRLHARASQTISAMAKPRRAPIAGKAPFRSPTLGWTLKAVSLAWFLFVFYRSSQTGGIWQDDAFPIVTQMLMVLLMLLPGLLGMHLGYRMCLRPMPETATIGEPVLFLRSFSDDGRVSLQPSGWSGWLQGSRGWRKDGRLNSDVMSRLTADYTFFQPIRVLRTLWGTPCDTCEESLAAYFRRLGPVVAIGRPGDALPIGGATRTYVSHENWQAVVLDLLQRAQVVVLQPGSGDGIWWEIEQTFSRIAPERILLCMINFAGKPDAYEQLRLRMESIRPINMPRLIPYLRTPGFVWFGRDWTAHLQSLVYQGPAQRAFSGDATDLEATLEGFRLSLRGETPPAKDVAPHARRSEWAGIGLVNVVNIALAALFLVGGAMLGGALLPTHHERVGVNQDAFDAPRTIRMRYGTASIELNGQWKPRSARDPFEVEFALTSGAVLLFSSQPQLVDAYGSLLQTVRNYEDQGHECSVLKPLTRNVRRQGVWHDATVRIKVTDGSVWIERLMYSCDPSGSLIVSAAHRQGDEQGIGQIQTAVDSLEFTPSSMLGLDAPALLTHTGVVVPWRVVLPASLTELQSEGGDGRRGFSNGVMTITITVAPYDGVEWPLNDWCSYREELHQMGFENRHQDHFRCTHRMVRKERVNGTPFVRFEYTFESSVGHVIQVKELFGRCEGRVVVANGVVEGEEPSVMKQLDAAIASFELPCP